MLLAPRNSIKLVLLSTVTTLFILLLVLYSHNEDEKDLEYFLRAPEELYQGDLFDPHDLNPPKPIRLPAQLQAQKSASKKYDTRILDYFTQGSESQGEAQIYHPYPKSREEYVPCRTARGTDALDDKVKAYRGTPKKFPKPVIGSYEVLGLDDVSFDRFGRYGSYGYGENQTSFNSGWQAPSKVEWGNINWAKLQQNCVWINRKRFNPQRILRENAEYDMSSQRPMQADFKEAPTRKQRTALLLRSFTDTIWMENDIYNLRSLITELSLHSGGEYEVFVLVHVKDVTFDIKTQSGSQLAKDKYLPQEFHDMAILFNDETLERLYPLVSEHRPIFQHFQPVQYFSRIRPDFDHYWQLEMDARYTGQHYHFFERLAAWSKDQARTGLWERSARFYIPSIHGSWDDFTALVRGDNTHIGVLGPISTTNVVPLGQSVQKDDSWGKGEDADLITIFPLIDPVDSGWSFTHHVYNFTDGDNTPRRASPGTMSRCSKQLLDIIHEAQTRGKGIHSEMTPATFALHHGLKAVYAPQPVYLDGRWPAEHLDKVLNTGSHANPHGGEASFLGWANVVFFHRYFTRFSFLWAAAFPQELYRSWMGWAKYADASETDRSAWEEANGRMILPGMFLHPVKDLSEVPQQKRAGNVNSFDSYRVG